MVTNCIICSSSDITHEFSYNKLVVMRCNSCGQGFVSEKSIHSLDLSEIYKSEYRGFIHDQLFQQRLEKEIVHNFSKYVPHNSRILDIGCGNGDFLKVSTDLGYDTTGVDISKEAVDYCVKSGYKAELMSDFEGVEKTFDVITMWDVIEHVQNPMELVNFAKKYLKEGGVIVIKTPLHKQFSFWLVKSFPFLSRSVLQIPAHIQFYSDKSMKNLLENMDFEILNFSHVKNMRKMKKVNRFSRWVKRLIKLIIIRFSGDTNIYLYARLRG